MKKMKIGLLPHYLELYDDKCQDSRSGMESFLEAVAGEFRKRGYDLACGRICRLSAEFAEEIKRMEKAGVQAVVSLHLAYSPSLESATELAATKLPLVVMDTTPDLDFTPKTDPSRIMFNHGIHGVQDMCNMLLRNGKQFIIEAGHWRSRDFSDRIDRAIAAAGMAHAMRNSQTGLIGTPFKGMGDFSVPFVKMKKQIGLSVKPFDFKKLKEFLPGKDSKELRREIAEIRQMAGGGKFTADELAANAMASIIVRRWLESENLSAFSMNFMNCAGKGRLPTVPFLEASRAMSRGIGYAGEGDVLTASLVAALMSQIPATTFTEMFCPDWKSNRIFMSHMGEVNPNLLAGGPELMKCGFPIDGATTPIFTAGRLKPGTATLVNLAPAPGDSYTLITAPVHVEDARGDKFVNSVRGWIRPKSHASEFLAEYSRNGGTHHLALSYGDAGDLMPKFAHLMGWRHVCLE